jgi:hypothetical protein
LRARPQPCGVAALLVAINGFLALVSLFALFGVWFDRLPAP